MNNPYKFSILIKFILLIIISLFFLNCNNTPPQIDVTKKEGYYGFGKNAKINPFLVSGWAFNEEGFTWIDGKESKIRIPLKKQANSSLMRLDMFFSSFIVPGKIDTQNLSVEINNKIFAKYIINKPLHYVKKIFINLDSLPKNDSLRIVFSTPNATSPVSTGSSSDTRELSFRFFYLLLNDVLPINFGELINFGWSGNSDIYKIGDWSLSEKKFTWICGKEASLSIPLAKKTNSKKITLKAKLAGLLSSDKVKSQTVQIIINDQFVGEWSIDKSSEIEKEIQFDSNLISKSNNIFITFKTPNALSPKECGFTDDTREQLSVRFSEISLIENN